MYYTAYLLFPYVSHSVCVCLVLMHGLIMTVFLCVCVMECGHHICVCVCVGMCVCLSVSQILAGIGTAHPAKCKLITGCCAE